MTTALPIPLIQLLQVLTIAAGAPGVTGVIAKVEARLQGRRGPRVLQPGGRVPDHPWLEIPVMLLVVVSFTWVVSGRRMFRVRRVPAWRSAATGVPGASSYTAFGYANPARRVLASVLHTRTEVRSAEVAGEVHLEYSSDAIEVVGTYLYRPGRRLFGTVVRTAKRLQSGRLDAYMLIALVAIIAAVTALA